MTSIKINKFSPTVQQYFSSITQDRFRPVRITKANIVEIITLAGSRIGALKQQEGNVARSKFQKLKEALESTRRSMVEQNMPLQEISTLITTTHHFSTRYPKDVYEWMAQFIPVGIYSPNRIRHYVILLLYLCGIKRPNPLYLSDIVYATHRNLNEIVLHRVKKILDKRGSIVPLLHLSIPWPLLKFTLERIDLSQHLEPAMFFACKTKHVDLLKFLLAKGANPATKDSKALRSAAKEGHVEVVRVLLQDKRADPAAKHSKALRSAAGRAHVEVLRVLVQDKRANPAAKDGQALVWASCYRWDEIVEILLLDKRTDPNEAFRLAVARGRVELVAVLLQDKRVNPSANYYMALRSAVQYRHAKVVKMLLQDGRAVPDNARFNFSSLDENNFYKEMLSKVESDNSR